MLVLARHTAIDLVISDGTTLRDSKAVDDKGVSMHPSKAKGTVKSWTQTKSNIGQWLNGRIITTILVGFDGSQTEGDYRGYIDDIVLTAGEINY